MSGPEPRISGFPEGRNGKAMNELLDGVADIAEEAFDSLKPSARRDEDLIEAKLMSKIKRYVKEQTGKRSHIEIIALNLGHEPFFDQVFIFSGTRRHSLINVLTFICNAVDKGFEKAPIIAFRKT